MSGIAIIKPLPIVALSGYAGMATMPNMLTPSPREVWVSNNSGGHIIDIDLGAVVAWDTVYVGGFNAPAGTAYSLHQAASFGGDFTLNAQGAAIAPDATGPTYQLLIRRGTAAPARYLRVSISNGAAWQLNVGIVAVGMAWQHPYAYGAGRLLMDSTRRAELFDGGFGVDQGVVKSGFRWRFEDLSSTELGELWAIVRDRGTSKPVIVVEDIAAATITEASIHYGLFDKFEAYERANAADTKWSLSMTEWR